ncbi:VOC family protein [Budviciaceae bacterium CWB-B4]|uniref:VOC family protein n=1 Tax=Limnobaculum xujianqingii TaxID=2738837 RepID=A0A9D7AJ89_9GAMM|nr:VOC family protein [Limnobaculum xujianqingii]MBK5073256.1 VOC family protein [Limnobaculum xujianqingii]MBK5177013.1 VOC family protein [Limnobaculum xujianqingii]
MLKVEKIHHIAVICADYERSKQFYCHTLGFELLTEHYRAERQSWKADLAINGNYQIELFSFPQPPARPTQPEACGLRHLAFSVRDLELAITQLAAAGVKYEAIRIDPYTGKRFTFFNDPDGLPLELYEESE